MRLRLPALLLATALLAAGCGDGTDVSDTAATSPSAGTEDAGTPTATASATATATASETTSAPMAEAASMDELLLTVPDLPDGWSDMDVASAEEDGPNAASNLCGKATGNLDWTTDAEATAKAGFSAGQGTVLIQQVSRLGADAAQAALDEFASAAAACDQWQEEGTTFTVQQLDGVPSLGDQMVAVRASAEVSGMTMTIDMVGWRHGDVDDGIVLFHFGGEASTDELVTILEAADAKFG